MDTADEGTILVDGNDISQYRERQLTTYRRNDIGFVFQFYNLVQNLTALENVELASQICQDPLDAGTVLADVGLGERMHNFPAQLSGESSRGSPSPGRSPRTRSFCCVMSRPERLTIRLEKRS